LFKEAILIKSAVASYAFSRISPFTRKGDTMVFSLSLSRFFERLAWLLLPVFLIFLFCSTNSASLYLSKSSDYPLTSNSLTIVAGDGPSSTSSSNASRGELHSSDRIALGIGIGIGLPATLATLIMCFYTIRRRG
jgi:hypothetical protein